MLKNFKIETKYNDVYDITEQVLKTVEESKVKEGTCIVYNTHSTAGLTVFSPWDPDGFLDLDDEIRRLVPTRVDFKHQHDTPQDAAGTYQMRDVWRVLKLYRNGWKAFAGRLPTYLLPGI